MAAVLSWEARTDAIAGRGVEACEIPNADIGREPVIESREMADSHKDQDNGPPIPIRIARSHSPLVIRLLGRGGSSCRSFRWISAMPARRSSCLGRTTTMVVKNLPNDNATGLTYSMTRRT